MEISINSSDATAADIDAETFDSLKFHHNVRRQFQAAQRYSAAGAGDF